MTRRVERLLIALVAGASCGVAMALVLLGGLALSSPAKSAEESLMGPIGARIVRVIDGDTLVVDARPWLGLSLRVHVRIRGIDAPERTGWGCPEERQLASEAHEVVERMVDGVELLLMNVSRDKYAGRVVAHVIAGGLDIGEELLRRGLAHPYDGGPRVTWCGGD